MISYIRNKQARIIASVNLEFVREKYFKKLNAKSRLVGLVGQRGVGKTTLMLQYLKSNFKPLEYLYFSADDVYLTDSSIYEIAGEFVKLGGRVLAIDEIHKYGNWANELKSIYDSFPNLIIRFSGSSMLNISNPKFALADTSSVSVIDSRGVEVKPQRTLRERLRFPSTPLLSSTNTSDAPSNAKFGLNEKYDLSRRVAISYVKPLSFREFIKFNSNINLPLLSLEEILNNHIELSTKYVFENPTLYKNFLKYLQIGYYPFFKEDEEEYLNKLFNACEKIINEDIPSVNRIDYAHLSIFKKFIAKLIYSKVPYKINISALSKEFGISHPTLMHYIEILESTKLIKAVRKYSKNISKKPAKIYFGNTNLLYTFSEQFGIEPEIETVRETFFANCFDTIYYSDIGDFKVDDVIFEVGGKNKSFKQIKDVPNSFLAIDTDYTAEPNKIPLWLFGCLY